MDNLDFGPIFTPTGSLVQIQYAQKAAEKDSTSIGLVSSEGIVIISEKPKTSELNIEKLNNKIKMFRENIFVAYSGMEPDFTALMNYIEDNLEQSESYFGDTVSANNFKNEISANVSLFTRYWSVRPMGINVISGVYDESEKSYNLFLTDASGYTAKYKACAIGKGLVNAKTELEYLEFENMTHMEMIAAGIKILYKIVDPMKDVEFDVEVCVLGKETDNKFKRIDPRDLEEIVEECKEMSFD